MSAQRRVLQGSVRRFDLYDIFSVFIPGATLVCGFVPFLPGSFPFRSPLALASFLVVGYSIGRGVHEGAIRFEEFWGVESHRDLFVSEYDEPRIVPAAKLNRFHKACCETFSHLDFCTSRTDAVAADNDDLAQLYTLVRTYIHMDSRGRSRTFQASYAFFRSMWLVSLVLGSVYFVDGALRVAGVGIPVGFQSAIDQLGLSGGIIIGIGCVIAFAGYSTFRQSKEKHKRLFYQYLIADFVVLYEQTADNASPPRIGS